MISKKKILLLILVLTAFTVLYRLSNERAEISVANILDQHDFYSKEVQPVFNAKCVACHSCFNSPCQLNLSSFEGLSRGASKIDIYDFAKLEPKDPTRLYIDGHNFKDWKSKGFYKVDNVDQNKNSILQYMITGLPGIESGLQNTFDSESSRVCVSNLKDGQRDSYLKKNPAGRMPYGFSKVSESELAKIKEWQLDKFDKPESQIDLEAKILNHAKFKNKISNWEKLFNGTDLKSKLSSRYIYEHLFLAHIYFEDQPKVFFRLVRSKTKVSYISEIPTVFPFDDPGSNFYYRLRPVTNTLTHKDHIPFKFDQAKYQALKKDFYDSKWSSKIKQLPAYGRAGANPFQTFKQIPIKARYNFLLLDASYHIMTFIKGPVCKGQTAVNVVNDHFWVMFVDPDKDIMVKDRKLELKIANNSAFPARDMDDVLPSADYRKRYWESVGFKFRALVDRRKPLDFNFIWNGDKKNTNSLLTIYRHFDSAQVLRGLRGTTPKTVWVFDYQVFESIYYNLTAGYNVFGPVMHQLNTRLFMEMSRLASEDMFLSFMPQGKRLALRESWNRKTPESKESVAKTAVDIFIGDVRGKLKFEYPFYGGELKVGPLNGRWASSTEKSLNKTLSSKNPSDRNIKIDEPKTKFLQHLISERFSDEQINSKQDYFENEFKNKRESTGLTELQKLSKLKGISIQNLPDTILLLIKDSDQIFTIVHNKAHYNVSMMFLEEDLRNPAMDTLDVISGVVSSYANLFVVLNSNQLNQFVSDVSGITSAKQSWAILKKYAVSRGDSNFWKIHGIFSERSFEPLTNESGILDLNRYLNI